jgi:ubiquitin carboxyl-terminal hydrolase 16
VNTSSDPVDLDIDAIILPSSVGWKPLRGLAVRKTAISRPPQVLAVHLVRSVYERGYGAERNGCEVTFEEEISIPVCGEAVQRKEEEAINDDKTELDYNEQYRLMSVVTHKGSHDSGHYLCYRRRKRTSKPRNHRRPKGREIKASVIHDANGIHEDEIDDVADKSDESGENVVKSEPDKSVPQIEQPDSRTKWWETSDEIVKGVNRADVLSKQKGVYILFYERTSSYV